MTMSPANRFLWRSRPRAPMVDMGQGRSLSAEDLLDGHFRRLTRRAATRTVEVQVDDQLRAAITVLAPDLSPLTRLAEELAGVVSDVHPEPRFRADLHRALEQTHRQHAAQRTLGTRTPVVVESTSRAWWAVPVIALIFVASLLWWRARRRAAG